MDASRSRYTRLLGSKIARLIIALLICTALTLALTGAVVSRYSYIINADNTQTIVYTSMSNPEEILASENIILGEYDTFDFSGIEDRHGVITVNRAKAVTVNADSKSQTVYFTKGTVKDALSKLAIEVLPEDLINVSLEEPINSDMTVTINRVTTETITTEKPIPFNVVKYPTQTLKTGNTVMLSQGTNGTLTTQLKRTYIDGKLVEEIVLSETVSKNPISSNVLIGDKSLPTSKLTPKNAIQLDKNGNPINYLAKYNGKATAYTAMSKAEGYHKPGHVAMDLSRFPKGTRLYIKTPDGSFIYGYSEVRDTGTAVSQGTILVDLYFNSYKESCLFGAKNVDVYVLP